jgi:hypothetical protein
VNDVTLPKSRVTHSPNMELTLALLKFVTDGKQPEQYQWGEQQN